MKTVDEIVFARVLEWLERGDRCWLCTIVATVGASPRPLGSLMGVSESGELIGSLSGGCIEDDLLEKVRGGELAHDNPLIHPYGVTPEENERLGLPCGGRLEVLIEPLSSDHLAPMREILTALRQRRCRRRLVSIASGQWQIAPIDLTEPLERQEGSIQQDFGPMRHLLLVGANELARCIAELATAMNYAVTVCDPRQDRIAQWEVAGVQTVCAMPDDVVRERAADAHSLVITLTHDPRIDDMALMEALQSQARYVGALGSERTSAKRRERLLQLDLTESEIARLHAPVGLPIGSKSAMEIAVAIMAELVQLKAQCKL
ncbi:XdhC family protein [Litorivivens sp.]|uniref:XdhC family protein n=1 Tax=Litorivivens sp. TaxID=2020868 RepID=UPI003561F629